MLVSSLIQTTTGKEAKGALITCNYIEKKTFFSLPELLYALQLEAGTGTVCFVQFMNSSRSLL
jgi:hypothetical protein